MKHNFKRFLSLLLALVMVLGMFPMTHAHAEGEAAPAVYQVTEVVDGGQYAFVYGNMRAAYNRVNGNNRLDAGNISLDTIKSNEGYRWTLEAVYSDGNDEIEGYRIKGVYDPKYLVLHEGTAALVDNEADAQVFTFEYTDAGFMIHDKNVADSYFNNFAGNGNIAGWTGGTGITVYRYEAEHIHNYVAAPAVEPTLNSAGLTEGTVCVCGAVGTGRETIPAKSYNDGIIPRSAITPTAGSIQPNNSTEGNAAYANDDNMGSMWHTNYNGSNAADRWLDFGLDGTYDVTALRYKGRNPGINGNITEYKIQVSYDGTSYQDLTTGTWADNADWKEVVFEAPLVQVKNVRLLAVKSNKDYAVAVEMCLVGDVHHNEDCQHVAEPIPAVEPTLNSAGTTEGSRCTLCGEILVQPESVPALDYNAGIVPLDHVKVSAGNEEQNGMEWKEGPATFAVDNDLDSLWHTDWNGTDSTYESYWFEFELTEAYNVTALRYKPRNGNDNGTIREYKIMVSHDGVNYVEAKHGYWENNKDWKVAEFDSRNVQYVRLVTISAERDNASYYVSAAELRLVGTLADHNHEFTTTTEPATCTTAGSITITCECGDTHTFEIPATGNHTAGTPVEENKNPATCTTAGSYDEVVYCSVCENEISRETKTIEPLNHIDENGDFICDREGCGFEMCTDHTYDNACDADCNNCGATRTPADHVYDNACDATCNECGAERDVPGHVYDNDCDADCNNCGATRTPADHVYDNDCDADCNVCNAARTPADHVYTNDYDSTCNVCNADREGVKQFDYEQMTGLTAQGSSVNPQEADKTVDLLFDGDVGQGNYWTTALVPVKDCWLIIDLGGKYLVNQVDYTQRWHSGQADGGYNCTGNLKNYVIEVRVGDGEWKQVAAGNTVLGTTNITFDLVEATQIRLTATESFFWDGGNKAMTAAEIAVFKGVCLNGDHTPADAVQENVAEDGSYDSVVYCSVCRAEISRETITVTPPEHVHIADAPVVENEKAATCTEDGSYDSVVYCIVCKAELSRETNTVPATHNSIKHVEAKAATCTEAGNIEHWYCADCGAFWLNADCTESATAAETVISALGHNDGPIVVENEKPSTCTEGGYYDAVCYCTVCGVETHRSHIEVGPDNHFPTVFYGHPATCTEPGLTDGTRCGVCLEWIEPQKEIPALGHCWERENADKCAIHYSCCECSATNPNFNTVVYFDNTETQWETVKATYWGDDGISGWAISQGVEDGRYAFLIHNDAKSIDFRNGSAGGETITTRTFKAENGKTYDANLFVIYLQYNSAWDKVVVQGYANESFGTRLSSSSSKDPKDGKHILYVDKNAPVMMAFFYLDGTMMGYSQFDVVKGKTYFYPECNHAYDEGVVTEAPTCAETGIKTCTCSICGETKTEVIPATGEHTYDYECSTHCNKCGKKTNREAKHVSDAEFDCVAGNCLYCGEDVPPFATHKCVDDHEEFAPTCVTAGYTLCTCGICGTTVTVPGDPATGEHAFDNDPTTADKCANCDAYAEAAKITVLGIEGEYDAEAALRFYISIPESLAKTAKIVLTKDGAFGKVVMEFTGADLMGNEHGAYLKMGVASGEMGRDITLTAFYGEKQIELVTSTGNAVEGNAFTSNLVEYATAVINGNYTDNEKAAAKALLVFGGYAQLKFNVDAENPVYNVLGEGAADLSGVTADNVANYTTTVAGAIEGVKVVSTEAVLDSVLSLRVYFQMDEGALDDYTIMVGGVELAVQYHKGYKLHYVEIPGIATAYADRDYTIAVTDADGVVVLSVTTSMLAWVRSTLVNIQNEKQINLAKALYLYNQAANELFGK